MDPVFIYISRVRLAATLQRNNSFVGTFVLIIIMFPVDTILIIIMELSYY